MSNSIVLRRLALALLASAGVAGTTAVDAQRTAALAQARTNLDISIFFRELAPHGRWLQSERHGYVFVPVAVTAEWRPYTIGRWVSTARHGWYWASDEPFGWATYHYGRWGYDGDYGWFWVPGSIWAPAWVAWQSSDDYIGWAPLPPPDRGYAHAVSAGPVSVGVSAWHFVHPRDFLAPSLAAVVIEPRRNLEILAVARPIGTVRVVGDIVVNNVIDVRRIEQTTGERVVPRRLVEAARAGRAEVAGDEIRAFTPRLAQSPPRAAPPNAGQGRNIANRPDAASPDADPRGREAGRRIREQGTGASGAGAGEQGRQQQDGRSEPRETDQAQPKQQTPQRQDRDQDGRPARAAGPQGSEGPAGSTPPRQKGDVRGDRDAPGARGATGQGEGAAGRGEARPAPRGDGGPGAGSPGARGATGQGEGAAGRGDRSDGGGPARAGQGGGAGGAAGGAGGPGSDTGGAVRGGSPAGSGGGGPASGAGGGGGPGR